MATLETFGIVLSVNVDKGDGAKLTFSGGGAVLPQF